MITYVLKKTGFLKRSAIWLVTQPFSHKNPWIFVTVLLVAPLILGSFMSIVPTLIVFIAVAEHIFSELGYKKGDRFPELIVMGILFTTTLSYSVTPIAHAIPVLSLSMYEADTGITLSFLQYSSFGIISGVISTVLLLFALRFVFKLDVSRIKDIDIEKLKQGIPPMTPQERYTLLIFFCVVLMWLLPGLTQHTLPEVYAFINRLGIVIPTFLGIVVLCIIRVEGKPLMDFNDTIAHGVPWGSMMLVASTMILSDMLTKSDLGIVDAITSLLAPKLNGLSPMTFVLIAALLTTILTNFASDTVALALMYSITFPLAYTGVVGGVNTAALTFVLGFTACLAIAAPSGSAYAAVAAGTGWIRSEVQFRQGLFLSIVAAFVVALVGYPFAALFV